jgi:hypothetical protein
MYIMNKQGLFYSSALLYSVSTDKILMWICEGQLVFITEHDLVYEDLKGLFPFQNMHI